MRNYGEEWRIRVPGYKYMSYHESIILGLALNNFEIYVIFEVVVVTNQVGVRVTR